MAKLTFGAAKSAVGVGCFIEKTIKFRDADGGEFEGEILVKRLSHDEIVTAADVWGLKDKQSVTIDQITKAVIFKAIFSSENEHFFPTVQSTGEVSSEIVDALYRLADEVNDLSGKGWISKQKMNSGANSSSTESVEEPLQKPEET
ncbi:hypothetical protein CDG60_12235 [Acinetobacter chinensis]|uniref:Phage tail protein n=1 Tax=Acinetobacter chinensis TaxID=2004650 RepID=A0A3B7LZ28_9GAMM|nr:hypothetical protein [Acinetobacter chinensis]AXY57265.1 hypothetical protein CDG60_12235 [Acinetobacter chinensis]